MPLVYHIQYSRPNLDERLNYRKQNPTEEQRDTRKAEASHNTQAIGLDIPFRVGGGLTSSPQ